MPIEGCTLDGRPGYKYGPNGTCYPYTPGSDSSKRAAHDKAAAQGRAVKASQNERGKK